MRGVLTPNSLQKNIVRIFNLIFRSFIDFEVFFQFCYNDPTVYSMLNGGNDQKMTFNPLQHSHSTSSIQSSHQNIQHHNVSSSTKRDNYYQITSSLARNEQKSPAGSSIRASTLPRNNQNQGDESNMIQIGLDPSNPFSRKSPTPRIHQGPGLLTTVNGKNPPRNGSQLSLMSERSHHNYFHQPQHHHVIRTNALNLGIPHTEAGSSYESPNGNMPRDLEGELDTNLGGNLKLKFYFSSDFDDLIKYSEEVEQRQQQQQTHHQHPNLKAKGSNVSIGGHSSGYQSIQTQSQSSSPIEIAVNGINNNIAPSVIQQNIEFFNKIQGSSSSSNASTANRPTKLNGKYGYISPKYSVVPPLAFKNPLYQMQNGPETQKSSSLTPSSSEERITIDQNMMNNNNIVSSSTGNVPGLIDTSSMNSRRMGSNRVPRTNPMVQVRYSMHTTVFTRI